MLNYPNLPKAALLNYLESYISSGKEGGGA